MLNTSTSTGFTNNGKPALIIHTDYGDLSYTAFALKALRQELAAVDRFITEQDQAWRRQNPNPRRANGYRRSQAQRAPAPAVMPLKQVIAASRNVPQPPAPKPQPQPQPQPATAPLDLPPAPVIAPAPAPAQLLDDILNRSDEVLDLNF